MAEDLFNAMLSAVLWSVAAGGTFGFIWAVVTCSSRKRSFISAGIPPTGQREWFVFSLFSMGGYVACITMLGMLTAAGALSHLAFWFLLVCSLAAFAAALLFGNMPDATLPEPMTHVPRHQAEPPRRPVGRPSWRPSRSIPRQGMASACRAPRSCVNSHLLLTTRCRRGPLALLLRWRRASSPLIIRHSADLCKPQRMIVIGSGMLEMRSSGRPAA